MGVVSPPLEQWEGTSLWAEVEVCSHLTAFGAAVVTLSPILLEAVKECLSFETCRLVFQVGAFVPSYSHWGCELCEMGCPL